MTADPRLWMALARASIGIALAQTVRIAWVRASRRWGLRRQTERARHGEVRAEALLRAAGYAIVARQAVGSWTVHADGAPFAVDLRADYLVSRDRRRFVAEVKTGRLAPRLETAATRRQLLEYRFAFDVDGVLLVDADTERVSSIEFGAPGAPGARRPSAFSLAWPLGLLIGAVAGALAVGALTLR
jgi:hypothetical protein